jgi:hypothetical protein
MQHPSPFLFLPLSAPSGSPRSVAKKEKIPAEQTQFQIAPNPYYINRLTPVF